MILDIIMEHSILLEVWYGGDSARDDRATVKWRTKPDTFYTLRRQSEPLRLVNIICSRRQDLKNHKETTGPFSDID